MIDPLHPTDAELAVQVETGTGALRLDLSRRLVAEALGTAIVIIAVIGSGIMARQLSPTDVGLQLLENAAATAGALIGLILIFGAVSGAHFNPVVTLVDRSLGTITSRDTGLYIVAQVVGGSIGAVIANVMFSLPAIELSTKERSSGALWLSEVVATVGLLLVIHGCVRTGRGSVVPFAVGLWIGGAYFFTSSTSFGAGGQLTSVGTLSVDDPLARALGAQDLDAEKADGAWPLQARGRRQHRQWRWPVRRLPGRRSEVRLRLQVRDRGQSRSGEPGGQPGPARCLGPHSPDRTRRRRG